MNDDFSSHFTTPSSSGDLGEELEGAFSGAEVWRIEGEVGIENANEGDVGKVEPFCDHLGAKEDVDFFGTEVTEGVAKGVFATSGVGVETCDFGAFENFVEDDFGFFSAVTLLANCGVLAVWADPRDDGLMAADMADEAIFAAVISERNGAVVTFNDMTARWALKGASEAAAV